MCGDARLGATIGDARRESGEPSGVARRNWSAGDRTQAFMTARRGRGQAFLQFEAIWVVVRSPGEPGLYIRRRRHRWR
jgi:hypothetical protein